MKPFQIEKHLKILSYASCFHQAFFQLKYSNIIHDHIIAQRHSHNFLFVNHNIKCSVYHMFGRTIRNSTNCSLLCYFLSAWTSMKMRTYKISLSRQFPVTPKFVLSCLHMRCSKEHFQIFTIASALQTVFLKKNVYKPSNQKFNKCSLLHGGKN